MKRLWHIFIFLAIFLSAETSMAQHKYLQLDGSAEYLRTQTSVSNSTQLTVEVWVNLSEYKSGDVGIIGSSAGAEATPIHGSTEGAWLLYLKNGKYPAFRVREIDGRGTSGYLASVVFEVPIEAVPADDTTAKHTNNWTHIAATVFNNEVTLYVDGEIAKKTVNNASNDLRMLTTSHPVWIGLNPNAPVNRSSYFPGGIKEVQVWRNALTQNEIRARVGGVVSPTNVNTYGDLRRGLQLYYKLDSNLIDAASNIEYQYGAEVLDLFVGGIVNNQAARFRDGVPHIKLTAPFNGSGVRNTAGAVYEIRWVSFGIGDVSRINSRDVELEYTLNGGNSWFFIRDNNNRNLTGNFAPDAEAGTARWEPYRCNDAQGNLRSGNPFSKIVQVRIRGTAASNQAGYQFITSPITVAPYFAIKKNVQTRIELNGTQGMNITGNDCFFDVWIRPYRFPTTSEAYFPIFSKFDTTGGKPHYALDLLANGQLRFTITDAGGKSRTALSDAAKPLVRPNSIAIDSAWTHIAVYVNLNVGDTASKILFYIDGAPQTDKNITKQLGGKIILDVFNEFPTFIGYAPGGTGRKGSGFEGEIRSVRFWNGSPNNTSDTGTEPTAMTIFVQGALTVRGEDLLDGWKENLAKAFSFNGGLFNFGGYSYAVVSSLDDNVIARIHGSDFEYVPVKPKIKLVGPGYKQKVNNSDENLRVRWVGFDYDGDGFKTGARNVPTALEFSIFGGGGSQIQPYQYLTSPYWREGSPSAMSLPDSNIYLFAGSGKKIFFACRVNASIADPDENNDGSFTDPGPLSATLVNARFRFSGLFTVEGVQEKLISEGPLFTVVPESNFTIRVLLEGYHDGENGGDLREIGNSFDSGGLAISLYRDNSGWLGAYVASAISSQGYAELNISNRGKGNNRFANVNYVFSDIPDDSYWIVVSHKNHLPLVSRFPAPFKFDGDDKETWQIESGWDFQSWNGNDGNVLPDAAANPWTNRYFTAYGEAVSSSENPKNLLTALVFNNGRGGLPQNELPAMFGGDVVRDGVIDENDRLKVRQDEATANLQSDLTGDGFVNADDRAIVDRNIGRRSPYNLPFLYETIIDESGNSPSSAPINEYFASLFESFRNTYVKIDDNRSPLKSNKTQAAKECKVWGEIKTDKQNYVDLNLYAQNIGEAFSVGNCTFAFTFDEDVLEFTALLGADSVIFSDNIEKGYFPLRTAPAPEAENPVPGLRTIEIDFDSFSKKDGLPMPYTKTFLGTLRFSLLDPESAVTFQWHQSSALHTREGENITRNVNFAAFESILMYSAKLVVPNGGEKYVPGREYKIEWTYEGDTKLFIELSTNGGYTWQKINQTALASNVTLLQWVAPQANSSDCLMRLVDEKTGIILDVSDSTFSIQPNFIQLVRPASADPAYLGGNNMRIVWVSKGYMWFRIEFSSNGGLTWTTLPGGVKVNASQEFLNWTVDKITTKSGLIRIIDLEFGNEIARSGIFKIIAGSVVFNTPKTGDTLFLDVQSKLRWTTFGVESFTLDLSRDGGSSWTTLLKNVFAASGFLSVVLSGSPTDNALLRAVWEEDAEMEFGESGLFSIMSSPSSAYDLSNMGIQIELVPNPSTGKSHMRIEGIKQETIRIVISDILGREMRKFSQYINEREQTVIPLELSGFSVGTYIVTVYCLRGIWSQPLINMK